MKAILISIKPEWVAKILDGKKTIEIRKTAPKCDLPIDVYIYCTKSQAEYDTDGALRILTSNGAASKTIAGRGKVVAKFTLRKVEKIINGLAYFTNPNHRDYIDDILEKACLIYTRLMDYRLDESFCAWYISDLVIFDKPKPLYGPYGPEMVNVSLDKAPQSWQYMEV